MLYDVVIIGGGPAGLSAALTLGRGRKRVLLCDAGPRRNAAAVHVNGFVTRDGITPNEFRATAREQLTKYPNVEVRDVGIDTILGEKGSFDVQLSTGSVTARRVLLATGMIDEVPDLEGFRALWGSGIFQCPYCHGWEVQDQRFGYLALDPEMLMFAPLLRGWTRNVSVFTRGAFSVPEEQRDTLARAGITLDERPVTRLVQKDGHLAQLDFAEGPPVLLDVLFAHPPQRHVALVSALGLTLDALGFIQVHEQHRETSRPGIYAAGDLTTRGQSAVLAAASGMMAAAGINHELTVELATTGALG